jgi:maltokinase
MAPQPSAIEALVVPFLERQPWYLADMAGEEAGPRGAPELVDFEVVIDGRPGLASVVLGVGDHRFHVLVGWREPALAPAALGNHQGAVMGACDDGLSDVLAYDALADEELSTRLLAVASGGREHAKRVRLVQSLVSHASLVYDERLFMKCYRVLEPAPRPEVELLFRLDEVGFNHLLGPVAVWERNGYDLALVREFVPGAVEGRALALTSLRDLLARVGSTDREARLDSPGSAGGDLASEMRRLGETTGRLHLALAAAFGTRPLTEGEPGYGSGPVRGAISSAIRVHGDFHLRRVMRMDSGWILAGFGDDPLIGLSDGSVGRPRSRFASPLEDLADLWFSLHNVAGEAVQSQPSSAREAAQRLADSWEERNAAAFLTGYLESARIAQLVGLDRVRTESTLAELVAQRAAGTPGPGA